MTQGPERNRLEALLAGGVSLPLKLRESAVGNYGMFAADEEHLGLWAKDDLPYAALIVAAVNALPGLLEIVALQEAALEAAKEDFTEIVAWGRVLRPDATLFTVSAALKAVVDAGLEKRP